AYVERARFPHARRRRVAETVRRLAGPRAAAVQERGDVVALPREDWAMWLAGLALLAGLAAFLVWLTVFRNGNDQTASAVVVSSAKTTVPKVTGIRYQAAQFQLKEAKLTSSLTQTNSGKPKGIVLKQVPLNGKTVQQGTRVALVVSKGPAGVAMPDLVGLAAADAARALRERKLVATLEQTPSTEAPGTVLAQDPKPGKRAKPGTRVTLQVAKGQASVAVPDVTGQTQQDAQNALRQAGFGAKAVQVPSSQPSGTVVAQNPSAGTKLARGSSVRLNVASSRGQTTTTTATAGTTTSGATTTAARTTTTPAGGNDYTGLRLADAVQRIASGRQQVIVQYVTSSQPAGVVVANSRAGSKERLQVSAGAKPKPSQNVPDTTGEDAQTAQQDLQSAGFSVVQVSWPVSDSSSDGMVVYQSPAAGGQVPQGSAIVIYVGSASGG